MSDESLFLTELNTVWDLNKVPLKIVPQSDDSGKRIGFVLKHLQKGTNIYEVKHKNPDIAGMVFQALFMGLVGGVELGIADATALVQLRKWEPPDKPD